MLRRSGRSPFAPDAFVFPGGTVDRSDDAPEAIAQTLAASSKESARANAPSALRYAAIREVFEEAGVLLACTAHGAPVEITSDALETLHDERTRIQHGERSFASFLQERGWYADASTLVLFSHWITPPDEPRRYDTRFFIARAPLAQIARADAYETHDGLWIAPAEALARHRNNGFHLIYPTIKHLERLSAFASVDDVETFARNKPIHTIMPNVTHARGFELPSELEGAW